MHRDDGFFSTFTFVTTSSTSLPPPPSSAALVHGSNTNAHYGSNNGGAETSTIHTQPHMHYLQLPPRIPQRERSRSAPHHGRARSKPYNIVKPIQKRLERTRRETIAVTPTRSPSRGGSRTPNLFFEQQQERPSNSTPLSSSGQIHTPMANFEASFDGIAALGFDFDAFGSNERLMASSSTLSASS